MPVVLIKLLFGLIVFLVICVVIVAGAVYFWVWPMAQEHLASIGTILQQPLPGIGEILPPLPTEEWGIGLSELIGALPLLVPIGIDGLSQIQQLAEAGFTPEEAQQALAILQEKLSPEQYSQLQEMLQGLLRPQ